MMGCRRAVRGEGIATRDKVRVEHHGEPSNSEHTYTLRLAQAISVLKTVIARACPPVSFASQV